MMNKPSGGGGAHGWWYVYSTSCELRRSLDTLTTATVWLDPDRLPKPGDTALHLRVRETSCSGGEPAGKRVKVAELVRTADEVRIAIGIEPQSGAFTCPGNPAEAFVVHLDEPLGDERVLDAAVYPARPFPTYRRGN